MILVSHTSKLSEVNSVHVQRLVRENADVLGYSLASDARGNWETTRAVGCARLAWVVRLSAPGLI